MIAPKPDNMQAAIAEAMQSRITAIVNEEAKAAAARVEERVRGITGEIAAKVAAWTEFQSFGSHLTITVRFPEKKGK